MFPKCRKICFFLVKEISVANQILSNIMNTEWTVDYAFKKLKENEDIIKGAIDSNEATTRMRAIDTIIFNVLGWDKLKVETEKHIRAEGFADYCLRTVDNIDLVLEAKRDGIYFLLPSRKYIDKAFGFGLLAQECRNAYDAMVQASGYATTLGSRYIAISNGHQWLLTLSYVPNQPIDERLVYVFESLDAIKERFQAFWDCFSFSAIQSNNPAIGLSESRKNPAPAKLSTTIPGYPLPIDRNHIKNELSYVLSIVWDELNANDNSKDFLKKCYIFPNSSDELFPIAKEIIEKRNKRDERLTEEALSVQQTPQLIKEYSSEKPILVLGEVGHGKSTFLKYLRLVEAENELKNYIQLDIDFLDRPDNHKEVSEYIFKEIVRQLFDRYNIDITENTFTRAALNAEINHFKITPRGRAFPIDSDEYKRNELIYIESFQRDHHEYLKYVFKHIKGSHGKSIALFLDNLDRRSKEIQEEAFLSASAMARDWEILIFACLRPSTYYRSQKWGVLDSVAPKIISINAPDSKILLKKRFEYALEIAKGNINQIPSGKRISVNLPTVAEFIECCMDSLRNNDLIKLFESVSNGNARRLLQYTKKIITNSHLDTKKIIKIQETDEEGYLIAVHEAERSLLYGDYQHYDPKGTVFINLFDIRHSDPIEHFCKALLLDFLNRSILSGIHYGYCRLNDIISYLSQLGYTIDYTKEMIKELLIQNCCMTSTTEDKIGDDEDNLIRITSLGRYHINVLINKFTYIDAIIIDTPIIDDVVRSQITDSKPIRERLKRSELFLGYLDSCSAHLQDKNAIIVWQKCSKKIREEINKIQRNL
jgi:predicted type IV restriction endonuclease